MKKGISLIVLVITIIVMIIITGAIIISLSSDNIIGQAGTAKEKWDSSAAKEELNTIIASNLSTIKSDNVSYRRTNMKEVIEVAKSSYGENNVKISAVKGPTYPEDPDESTEEDLIESYLTSMYSIDLFNEFKEYIPTIPGLGISQSDVLTHFQEREAAYESEYAALIDGFGYSFTGGLTYYPNTLGEFNTHLSEIMSGDALYYENAIETYKEFSLYFNITLEIIDGNSQIVVKNDSTVENYTAFVVDENGVITGCVGEVPANMVVPSTVRGTTVTGIAANTFKNNTTIKSFEVGDLASFTVGTSAFEGCTNLESISLAADSFTLSAYAFNNCTGLTKIYMHLKTVPNFTNGMFESCTGDIVITGKNDLPGGVTNEYLEGALNSFLPDANSRTYIWQ